MNPYVFMLVLSCLTACVLGSAILARDPDQRPNRLIATVLGCSAYWSLCEILWNLSDDSNIVVWLIRLSSFGWIPLGALALDLFVEVTGNARSRIGRIVPAGYATAGLAIALYLFTPWCVQTPIRVSWGWSYSLGPLFPLAFLPTILYVCSVLVMWPSLGAKEISPGEKRQVLWMFFGILLPATVASITDVLMPWRGIHVPRLGSTSILVIGGIVAWFVRRYGYFLLAPGAFTREILETLRNGVALLRSDGRIRSCNEALARLIGVPRESLCEWPISEFLPALALDVSDEILDRETALSSCYSSSGEIPVSVSSSPLRDDKGEVIGCVIAVRDLREVMTLRSRLVTSSRLAAVGELAAGIAHEINNPITFVRANLVALRKDWSELAVVAESLDCQEDLDSRLREGEEILEESVEGVDRIATIVRDVGTISHAGVGNPEMVCINELLDNAANVAALSFSVTMERCYSELPRVRCAPQQLKQVFLNLLINSFQAIGDHGNIRLVTGTVHGDVEIRIEDDGCGIPEEDIERIFDPFFTTRPVGEGTGLGLALCYQIVRNHGGEINVESEVDVGTSFRVRLPAAQEAAAGSA
jgi:PAS domain S-box-containing protein